MNSFLSAPVVIVVTGSFLTCSSFPECSALQGLGGQGYPWDTVPEQVWVRPWPLLCPWTGTVSPSPMVALRLCTVSSSVAAGRRFVPLVIIFPACTPVTCWENGRFLLTDVSEPAPRAALTHYSWSAKLYRQRPLAPKTLSCKT